MRQILYLSDMVQRYIVSEIFTGLKINIFKNRYVSTFFVILTAAILAFASGADGKGGYKWAVAGIPAIIMSFITFYAIVSNQLTYIKNGNILLIVINSIIILCCLGVVIESIIRLQKK